jgi:hypothetical protein
LAFNRRQRRGHARRKGRKGEKFIESNMKLLILAARANFNYSLE